MLALALLLPALAGTPAAGESSAPAPEPRVRVDPAAVQKAMKDELARSMTELRLGDEARPFFLAYTVSDLDQATISGTFGAITSANSYRGRVLRTELRVGDSTFDNTNFEGGPRVDTIPMEDDYAALRRELWLRTDESYKSALETLARKRAAAASQAEEEELGVGDFSKEAAVQHEGAAPAGAAPDTEGLRATVARLSALFRDFPKIYDSRVTATHSLVRRRLATSEGTWVDDTKRLVRIEVVASTQADDGMKLRSFVPFSALDPGGLPPLADMEKAVRAMATELAAMRMAPVAKTGAGAVLFEGMAAAQIVKMLLADQLSGTPPPKTASAAGDDGGRQTVLSSKLGQKVAATLLSAVDDPLAETGPGKAPLFGAYRVDDEGVPAQRVSLVEHGVLKSLLMTRTPRKEIARSNGHGRAPRFSAARAHIGVLTISGSKELPRKALLDELGKIAKGGGVTTYIVRLLDDGSLPPSDSDDFLSLFSFGMGSHGPPPVRPLVVYRVAGGKEELVRGLTLENLLTRSLKDVTAVGKEPVVYNYVEGGSGFSGIPATLVTPALLFSDVDIRKQTGKNRKPPLYPPPGSTGSGP